MRVLLMRLLGVVLLTSLFALSPRPTEAGGKGRWGFGDDRYVTIDRVCRDGLEFSAVAIPASRTNPTTVSVLAREFTTTGVPDPDPANSSTWRPFAQYGSLLAPTQTYSMPLQSPPLPADINNNGSIDPLNEQFNVYLEGGQYLWPRNLAVGARVVMYAGAGVRNWETVEDCFLQRPSVIEGQSLVLTSAQLNASHGRLPAADLVYTLTGLPPSGAVRLNGVALTVGGTFTQDDVNNGRVSYLHNGNDAAADTFTYRVSGTTRVSVTNAEAQATGGGSQRPSASTDGGYVAFDSAATNLTPGADGNGTARDVFLRNLYNGTTTLISRATNGTQGNDDSTYAAISPDGSVVAFESDATNLGQVGQSDTCLVFPSSTDAAHDVYMWRNSSTQLGSRSREAFGECYRANGNSYRPSLSNFGTELAFYSLADNLMRQVNGAVIQGTADTNSAYDAFFLQGIFTENWSMPNGQSSYGGTQSNSNSYVAPGALSENGEHLAFYSNASNLSANDADTTSDVFVRFSTSTTVLISRSGGGAKGNGASYDPTISADGRYVAFESDATNLVTGDTNALRDVFLRDRDTDGDQIFDETGAVTTTRVSLATGGAQTISTAGNSYQPHVAAYGRFVVFYSYDNGLVAGDTNACGIYSNGQCPDVFLRDTQTGVTERISLTYAGAQANNGSYNPRVSGDGEYITFESDATNLVTGDTNAQRDVFQRYRGFTTTVEIAITPVYEVFLPLVVR